MKTLKYFLLTAIFGISLFYAKAQYPRKVLYELFTNAYCSPCVGANTYADYLADLYPNDAILLKYHVGFPGPLDIFYLDNPVDPYARFFYYGLNSIPSSFVDGTSYFNITSRIAVPSPFEIKTSYTVIDNPVPGQYDSVYVTTVVKAGTNVFNGNLKLRTAAVLKYYGNAQGLFNDFRQVVRLLSPDSNGIAMPFYFFTGDSIVSTTKMALDSKYDLHQLEIVTFLQDDTTKEVFQAAVGVDDPLFKITSLNTSKPGKMVDASGAAYFTFPFRIQTKNTANFEVTLLPYPSNNAAWSQNMTINGLTGNLYNLQLGPNTDTIIDVHINALCPPTLLHQTFMASINIHNTTFTDPSYLDFNALSPQTFYISAYSRCTNVLTGGFYSAQTASVFTSTGNGCLYIDRPLTEVDTVNFNKASVNNLFVTYASDTLRNELPFMTNLLNSGGNVALDGDVMHRDIADINAPPGALSFYSNYMGALYTGVNTQSVTVNAVPTDIFYGSIPAIGPLFGYVLGQCGPLPSSPNCVPIFTYNNSFVISGLRNTNGNFKTALFGFYIGCLNPLNVQNQVIQSTINWFNSASTTGTSELNNNLPAAYLQNFPNPAKGTTTISITSSIHNKILKVFDMTGRMVIEEKILPNAHAINLNVSKLSNGMYTYSIMEDGDIVSSKRFVVEN